MASPKLEVFFIYNLATGAPQTGIAGITFDTYKNDLGVNVANPTISEIGGGAYGFTPVFADPARAIVYVINVNNVAYSPQRVARFMRPEDWTTDDISTLLDYESGKWEIVTTGGDANRIIYYAADGVTVLKKFDLTDDNGDPTSTNPFVRTPV